MTFDTRSAKQIFQNSVLLAREVRSAEHRANPFFNILNLTSKSVASYPDLFMGRSKIWRLFHSFSGAFFNIFLALIYWPKAIKLKNSSIGEIDVLIISHLNSKKNISDSRDFYFSDLQSHTALRGYKTHTFLINHCRADVLDSKKLVRKNTNIFPAFFPPWKELINFFTLLSATFSVPNISQASSFRQKAQLAQFGSTALGNFRIAKMIMKVIEQRKPRFILHTFEGHGWERILAAEVHKISGSIKVLGYQHTVMFPGIRAINFRLGGGADPDHIFTIGNYNKNLLENESEFKNISVIGSNKFKNKKDVKKPSQNSKCLFAPEGVISEVILMAKFALETARIAKNNFFLMRLHPVLEKEKVLRLLQQKFGQLEPNFSISADELEVDLENSAWVCYRGSTVVVEGILNKLRPIYLDIDGPPNFNDPLPQDFKFRRVASKSSDLIRIMNEDLSRKNLSPLEISESTKFVDDYIMRFDPNLMVNHLDGLN